MNRTLFHAICLIPVNIFVFLAIVSAHQPPDYAKYICLNPLDSRCPSIAARLAEGNADQVTVLIDKYLLDRALREGIQIPNQVVVQQHNELVRGLTGPPDRVLMIYNAIYPIPPPEGQ